MAINLLPWREQRAVRRTRQYGLLLAASIVTLSILTGSLHYLLGFLAMDYQLRNVHLAQEIKNVDNTGNIQKLSADYQTTDQQIKLIQAIQNNQSNFWRDFSFLQKNLPIDIQLTQLEWVDDELHLQGSTTQSEHVGSLIKSLEISHFFSQIFLDSIAKENNEPLIHFTIRAHQIQEPAT